MIIFSIEQKQKKKKPIFFPNRTASLSYNIPV